jgi:TPR repeat protein
VRVFARQPGDQQQGLSLLPAATRLALLSLLGLALFGCQAKDSHMNDVKDIPSTIKAQLAFTCSQESERIPPRDPEAEQLYKHARWLVRGNTLQPKDEVFLKIERLVRIATAYGHDKANTELRQLIQSGKTPSVDRRREVLDLTESLIARGIPSGYYAMGWYVERGYGVKADPELALKYYRKSADLGSPEGQFLVGDKLGDLEHGRQIADIGMAMWRCAADQRHAEAAGRFAIHQQAERQYADAMRYYQIAAAVGQSGGAHSLANAFSVRDHANPDFGLGQAIDAERERRYRAISDFLGRYDYLHATVAEIDTIVPLPPAPLPAWNGKFQWLQAHEANVPPPLPTEERIAEMARAKGLDPKTGRPVGR